MKAYLQLGAGHTTWMRRKEDFNYNEDMRVLYIDFVHSLGLCYDNGVGVG